MELAVETPAPATLAALDADVLVLPSLARRAQPKAILGLADWELGGRLAVWIRDGRFSGGFAEQLLAPTLGRLGPRALLLFGLGDGSDPAALAGRLARALGDARARHAAVASPEWAEDGAPFLAALAPAASAAGLERLTVLVADADAARIRAALGGPP